ncbi:MAG: hypothetical protein RLN75_02185 [Longimicrobiales bacterium]
MAKKRDLEQWIVESLRSRDGRAHLVEISRDVWMRHESDLRASGDLFFTWQYDLRWAAKRLRDRGALAPADDGSRGVWVLADERG